MPQQKCHASVGEVYSNCGMYIRYFLPVQMVSMTIHDPIAVTMTIDPPVSTPLPWRWRFLQTAATYYETTRHHIPEDSILQRHRLKNHKSYNYGPYINKCRSGNDKMLANHSRGEEGARWGRRWNKLSIYSSQACFAKFIFSSYILSHFRRPYSE